MESRGRAVEGHVEWHDSGAHLVERGTAELPKAPANVSFIGGDGANGTVLQAVLRRPGRLPRLRAEHRQRRVEALAEGEPFTQRFTATFGDDGNTITGRWEIAEDGTNYKTDFDIIYRRVDG